MIVITTVDDDEPAIPARVGEEVRHDAPQLPRAIDRRTIRRRRRSSERPVDHERTSRDHRSRYRSPVARVAGAIAVVAHREVAIPRHGIRLELIARSERLRQRVVARIDLWIVVQNVRLVELASVDEHSLVVDLDNVAGQTDDALHEIGVRLERIAKDDDVAAADWADGKETAEVRAGAEDEFVDDEVIADKKVVVHRRRRNLECLKDEDAREVDEDDRDQESFVVFAQRRLLGFIASGHWREGFPSTDVRSSRPQTILRHPPARDRKRTSLNYS